MGLLEASHLSKSFGGIAALCDVSLALDERDVVGLVGPNGAGKTTLFDCITGLARPDSGSVVFDGVVLDDLPAFRRSRLGVARTFQRLQLFAGMSAREHLHVTERVRSGSGRLWKDLVGLGMPTPAERGTAILLVEHDLGLVTSVVDRLVVLDSGRVMADGAVQEVLADPRVRRVYLGAAR